MSQIICSRASGLFLFAFLALIAGCGDPNPQAVINPDTGTHLVANWASPDTHGAAAKADPAVAGGLRSCQECHSPTFSGGISRSSCLDTAGCHGAGVNAPHSPAPWRGGSRSHTSTHPGNASECGLCHLGKRQPPSYAVLPQGSQPACFNNTLCHGQAGHPAGWADPTSHGATAKTAPSATAGFSSCQPCHGADFNGGTVQTTCLNTAGCHGAGVNAPHSPAPWRGGARTHTNTDTGNAAVCALCHRNNNAGTPGCFNNTLCHGQAAAAPHAVPFTDPALHGPAAKNDLTYCQDCHAIPANGGAGSNPRFNVAVGSLSAGCEDCHAVNTAHPVPWKGSLPSVLATAHVTAGNMLNACTLCHGAGLAGGTGPACGVCHAAGSPLTLTNCTSCHGRPPAGTSAPNREGAHSEHNALPKVVNNCNACHTTAGTGTLIHDYTGGTVNVSFLTAYNGNGGVGTYTTANLSCGNVSCHGGPRTQTSAQAQSRTSTLVQTTSWLTGTINVSTQCTACHVLGSAAGNPEDNSYYSGRHYLHVYQQSIACTTCHNTTSLAVNHFTNLDTAVMEGPASATLNPALQYNGSTCDPNAGGLNGCHGSKDW